MRVWDVGEELFPHADRWASLKTRCILRLENSGPEGCCDFPETLATADDIATLEATMVDVRGDECRDQDTTPFADAGAAGGNSARVSSGLPSKPASTKKAEEGCGEAWKRAQSTLAVIRPELFRQAGALPVWRLGRVTAVIDLSREATTTLRPAANTQRPLVEVRGWSPQRRTQASPRRLDDTLEHAFPTLCLLVSVGVPDFRDPIRCPRRMYNKHCREASMAGCLLIS